MGKSGTQAEFNLLTVILFVTSDKIKQATQMTSSAGWAADEEIRDPQQGLC
jgi:hypothetical protein